MSVSVKSFVTLTTATLALLIGFIWLRKRKKPKPSDTQLSPHSGTVKPKEVDQDSDIKCKELFSRDEKLQFISRKELVTVLDSSLATADDSERVPLDNVHLLPDVSLMEGGENYTGAEKSLAVYTENSTEIISHGNDQDSVMEPKAVNEENVLMAYSGLQGSTDENQLSEMEANASHDVKDCSKNRIIGTEDGSTEISNARSTEWEEVQLHQREEYTLIHHLEEQTKDCSLKEVIGAEVKEQIETTQKDIVTESNEIVRVQTLLAYQTNAGDNTEVPSVNIVCESAVCPIAEDYCDGLINDITTDVMNQLGNVHNDTESNSEVRNHTVPSMSSTDAKDFHIQTQEKEISKDVNSEQDPSVEMQSGKVNTIQVDDKNQQVILPETSIKSTQRPSILQKKGLKPSHHSDMTQQKTPPKSVQNISKTKIDHEKDGSKKKNSPSRGYRDSAKKQRNKVINAVETKALMSSRIDDGVQTTFEFDFPTPVCGMLIGKMGRHVNQIKDLSGVDISVRHKMYTKEHQLVILKGTQTQIETALVLLRERFPIDRFPDVTFEPAEKELPIINLEQMQLVLPESVPTEVKVSSVVSPNHVFVQQLAHPSFLLLETLNQSMNACYAQDGIVPQLPRPIEVGVICAAPVLDTGWYRAQVVESYPETDEVELRFLDYGGYMGIQGCMLRQIRCDFSQLPFQAVECYLADVLAPNECHIFPPESNDVMQQLVKGRMLQAQVVGHEVDGVPYIKLCEVLADQTLCINSELVKRGIAESIGDLGNGEKVPDNVAEVSCNTSKNLISDATTTLISEGSNKDTIAVKHVVLKSEDPSQELMSVMKPVEKSSLHSDNLIDVRQSGVQDVKDCSTDISNHFMSQDLGMQSREEKDPIQKASVEEDAVIEEKEESCLTKIEEETKYEESLSIVQNGTICEKKDVPIKKNVGREGNGAQSCLDIPCEKSVDKYQSRTAVDMEKNTITQKEVPDCKYILNETLIQLNNTHNDTDSCTETESINSKQTSPEKMSCVNITHKTEVSIKTTALEKGVLESSSIVCEEVAITLNENKLSDASHMKQNEKITSESVGSHIKVTAEEASTSCHVEEEESKCPAEECRTNLLSDLGPVDEVEPKAIDSGLSQHSESDSVNKNLECVPSKKDISKSAISKEENCLAKGNSTECPPVEITATANTEDEISNTLDNVKKATAMPGTSSNSPSFMNSAGSSEIGSNDHDLQSEISADSGRGGSVAEISSPARSPSNTPTVYQFDFPTVNCGMLIGRRGRQINRLKDLSGVEISVKHKKYSDDYSLVLLEGTQAQIEKALTLLRERFPVDKFPDITFEPAEQDQPVLRPEQMQLSLPDGVPIDVLVSSVVAPNHVFLQQPTHPSFHMLQLLNDSMNACYSQADLVPQLPRPIEVGVICAAPVVDAGWYRAQVVESYPETDEVELRFLDYGGYMGIQGSMLRQIRFDFSQLPFQAVECYLANVMPPDGAEAFPPESVAVMQQLVHSRLLQAQVVGHEVDSVPYIQLYELQGDQAVLINKELVERGVAQWIEQQS